MFTVIAGRDAKPIAVGSGEAVCKGVGAFLGMATRRARPRQDGITVRIGGTIMDYCLGVLEVDSIRFSGTPCRRGEEQQQEGRGCMNPYIVRQSNQILGVRGDSYGIRIGY